MLAEPLPHWRIAQRRRLPDAFWATLLNPYPCPACQDEMRFSTVFRYLECRDCGLTLWLTVAQAHRVADLAAQRPAATPLATYLAVLALRQLGITPAGWEDV